MAPARTNGDRHRVDGFAGSCSLQGTVNFTPRATLTQQKLYVRHDAGGT
jgi:hypothetical protein